MILNFLRVLKKPWQAINSDKHFLRHAKSLFNNDPIDGVIITDHKRHIIYINKAFTIHTGYSEREALGKTPKFLQGELTDKDSVKALQLAIEKQEPISIDLCNYRKDGSTFWNSFTITPYFNSLGHLIYWVGIQRNITDLKNVQQNLLAEKNKAEQLALTKSQFLANMSHEIRTPMNGVINLSSLAQECNNLEEMKQYLRQINTASSHLMTILNDILELSKIEANGFSLQNRPFVFKDLLDSILLLFPNDIQNFTLNCNCPCIKNKSYSLIGDDLRLKQILLNLLSNAFKFTPIGRVTLEIAYSDCSSTDKNINRLKFSIHDTGIGISEAKISQLFHRFSQADNTITRRFGGTGLGLVISQKLVQSMGGEIKVESKLGQGSTFSFELDFESTQDYDKTIVDSQLINIDDNLLSTKRVLLVEDDSMNQIVAKLFLNKLNIKDIEIAENGAIAIELMTSKKFDVVLMDIQMPIMDGLQATQLLRKTHNINELPIIGMSAGVLMHEKEACLEVGMNSFIAKPIIFECLKNELVNVLVQIK